MIWVNARAIIERITNNKTEVIVQWRNKNNANCWEFPGGTVEECESFFAAVKREVKEETGLDITFVTGQNNRFQIGEIECFKPYSVYQTVREGGGFDSMGVHFICSATGELLLEGDDTKDIKWIGLDELKKLVETENLFLSIDKVAAVAYLKEKGYTFSI